MEPVALVSSLRTLIDIAQPEWRKGQAAVRKRFVDETSRVMAQHHVYVVNWCQDSHGFPVPGDPGTIELSMRSIARRFGVGGKELNELDVLFAPRHVVVLGDPGAGKTTTLRRLAGHVALDAGPADDDFEFVLVVVCREERWKDDSLYDVLGRKTGVTGKLADALDNPESRIRAILDVGVVIIVDGLDEVPRRHRTDLERDITDLGRHLGRSKLIVSCRSGDYTAALEGFDVAEIQPLTPAQIKQVVYELLGPEDALAFYDTISKPGHPAARLANRPLFLLQMVRIFQRRGSVPERPTYLYESITRLIIQDWDEHRGVRRASKYDQFGVDDKRRFLADLAYELLGRHLLRFSENDLVSVYLSLADRYSLPQAEARQVARELEAHTGLLVESGDEYEFSHFSLQEFLAAESMVRGTRAASAEWWIGLTEVAAVAAALAQDANGWLDQLMEERPDDLTNVRPLSSFLYRLGLERPRFERSVNLGQHLLRLLFRGRVDRPETVAALGTLDPVRKSVADALKTYDSISRNANETRLALYSSTSSAPIHALAISTPVLEVLISRDHLNEIAQASRARSER